MVSNSRDDMSRFVIGVSDHMKEKFCTAMIHNDMNLSRLMVDAQSIEVSNLSRILRNFKKGGVIKKTNLGLRIGIQIIRT